MGKREEGERRKNGRAVGSEGGRSAHDRAGSMMDVFKKPYDTARYLPDGFSRSTLLGVLGGIAAIFLHAGRPSLWP